MLILVQPVTYPVSQCNKTKKVTGKGCPGLLYLQPYSYGNTSTVSIFLHNTRPLLFKCGTYSHLCRRKQAGRGFNYRERIVSCQLKILHNLKPSQKAFLVVSSATDSHSLRSPLFTFTQRAAGSGVCAFLPLRVLT